MSGFFAVTSNTVQVGGDARLHAGGAGISLDASVGVKALFVFSPFSVRGEHRREREDLVPRARAERAPVGRALKGRRRGTSKGEVCVSIICLGRVPRVRTRRSAAATRCRSPSSIRGTGSSTVQGLLGALQDPGNWSALPPPGAFSGRVAGARGERSVDPLGGLTVRQKAVPVETALPIARFGPAKAAEPPDKRTGRIFFKGAKVATEAASRSPHRTC